MAEKCSRKAFNLVSSLGVLKQELEKGLSLDEASVQADMAKSRYTRANGKKDAYLRRKHNRKSRTS